MVQSFKIFSKFVGFYLSVSFNTVWVFIRTLWFCPWLSVSFSLLIFPAGVMTLGWEIFVVKTILVLHLVLNLMDATYFYICIWTICFLCFIYVKENMELVLWLTEIFYFPGVNGQKTPLTFLKFVCPYCTLCCNFPVSSHNFPCDILLSQCLAENGDILIFSSRFRLGTKEWTQKWFLSLPKWIEAFKE